LPTSLKRAAVYKRKRNHQTKEQRVNFEKETAELLKKAEYQYNSQKLTMTEHEDLALKWGGHIASVHSLAENRHIHSLAQDKCWLGGMRRITSQVPTNK
jgi:hypothetical protein